MLDAAGGDLQPVVLTDTHVLLVQVLPGLSGGAEGQEREYFSNGPLLAAPLSPSGTRMCVFSGVQLSVVPQRLLCRL